MAKRSATTDLNHDNWDIAEEKEDPGKFAPLSGSELKNRVIRKAKRSLNTSATGTSSAASSPFAKFSGFSTNTASSPFFSGVNKTSSPFSGAASKTEGSADRPFQISQESKNSIGSFFGTTKKLKEETPNGNTEGNKNSEGMKKPAPMSGESSKIKSRGVEYCKHLKNLNESVVKWMQKYLDKNACCDFTPVFNDYRKHMDSLNMKYPVREVETVSQLQGADVFKKTLSSDDNSNSTEPKFKIEPKQQKDETDYGAHFSSNTTNTSTFSFGINKTPTATSSNSPLYSNNSTSKEGATKNDKEETKPFTAGFFSQGNKEENKGASQFSTGFFGQNNKDDNKGTSQFSAGFFSKPFQSSGDKPFSFATAPVEKSAEGGDKEEEYVPPKNDFVAVSEEGAVYSKRYARSSPMLQIANGSPYLLDKAVKDDMLEDEKRRFIRREGQFLRDAWLRYRMRQHPMFVRSPEEQNHLNGSTVTKGMKMSDYEKQEYIRKGVEYLRKAWNQHKLKKYHQLKNS